MFMSSKTLHNGAIFAMGMQGKCLYTGGWDKNVNIQVEMQNLVLFFFFGNYTEMNLVKSVCYVNPLH